MAIMIAAEGLRSTVGALGKKWCPRQGSHTGPLDFRGRAFRLIALLAA